MHNTALADISRYYDTMHVWTRLNAGFRSFSGWHAGTIHCWLTNPATGEFSPTTIHHLMLETGIEKGQSIEALDAGCGYGGTMLALRDAVGGRWHGITISRRQYAVGRKTARQKGLGEAVTFALQSYDAPQARSYNLIYAIESLIHSASPEATVRNLAQSLRPGGTFIIVDDMPVGHVPPDQQGDLERFKALWRCPVMPSEAQWSAYLEHEGCEVIGVRDLTPLMRPRLPEQIAAAMDDINARRRWRDHFGLRRIGESEIGGLLLEKLVRDQVVHYKMIHARKRT